MPMRALQCKPGARPRAFRLRMLVLIALCATACARIDDAATARAGDPPASAIRAPAELTFKDGVDYSCRSTADCAIKDVGNCCGYYPACVNVASETFPERVKAECVASGMNSICGFPSISECQCLEGRCTGVAGVSATIEPGPIESGPNEPGKD